MDNLVFDFWQKLMMNMWSKAPTAGGIPFAWPRQNKRTGANPWSIPFALSQTISDSFADLTGDKRGCGGEIDSLSELVLSLMQTGLDGYHGMQKKWMAGFGEGASPPEERDFSHVPLVWLESFQKLLSPILDLPVMSLPGPYQETTRQLISRYTAFSAKMGELMYQLYLPMDKASRSMLKTYREMAQEGKPLPGAEEPGAWIAELEKSYMEILQSPKYTELLHQTVDAYREYCLTRQKLYAQSSKTQTTEQEKEMDVSQEISKLKERLDELLKRVDSQVQPAVQNPVE